MHSPASSPPASSKTHAFFASSFTASPPLPRPPPAIKKFNSGSSTESNDEPLTPSSVKADSPTTASIFNKSSRFNVSRIFPSRYTRARRDSEDRLDVQPVFASNALRRKPDFLQLDLGQDIKDIDDIHRPREHSFNDIFLSLPTPAPFHDRSGSDSSFSPPSSICSSNSHVEIPLPTPPPPPPLLMEPSISSDGDFTPRLADLGPPQPAVVGKFKPLKEETIPVVSSELHEGDVITDMGASLASPSLRLQQPLGQGAFSSVWLAEDLTTVPLTLASKKSVRDLKRQASLQKKGSLSRNSSIKSTSSKAPSPSPSIKRLRRRIGGVRPTVETVLLEAHPPSVDEDGHLLTSPSFGSPPPLPSPLSATEIALPGSMSRSNSTEPRSPLPVARVVAVKLTPRRPDPDPVTEERTRVGFIREVEVLRHISHPNITPLLSFFTTPSHHVLVLPYLKGGDLLSLVNNDTAWARLSEGVLRRMWCELCRAVGWMHSVGIVHRDIKLENVLLSWEGFSNGSTSPIHVSDLPVPIIKLSDFGLSRFIDIGNGERGQGEMLSTRCGSEAYAAPELVMGGGPRGVYDARETDAWACGVVLYALVGRKLPFGEGVGMDGVRGNMSRIGGERVHAYGYGNRQHAVERRAWLMRIARGEYGWPEATQDTDLDTPKDGELVGSRLPLSEGAKRIVGRLLVRDPKKRSRIVELWEDEWMRADEIGEIMWENLQQADAPAEGDPHDFVDHSGVLRPETRASPIHFHAAEGLDSLGEGEWEPLGESTSEYGEDINEEEVEEEEEEDGWLLDEGSIASIARQEVI